MGARRRHPRFREREHGSAPRRRARAVRDGGVGTIFEAYRDGRLEDDDEVAVVHGPEDTGDRAGSDARVNIRATVGKARSSGVLDEESAAGMLGVAKRLYYAERTYARVMEIAEAEGIPASTLESFRRWLPAGAVNQKRDDAVTMLQVMHPCLDAGCAPGPPAFVFEDSLWWHELQWRSAERGSTMRCAAARWPMRSRIRRTDG